MKRAQTPVPLDSADEEDAKQILAAWRQAPPGASTPPTGFHLGSQVESDVKQLQGDVCQLLAGLNDLIQEPTCFPVASFSISQLCGHTALLNDWNQQLQATLCFLGPSYSKDRINYN